MAGFWKRLFRRDEPEPEPPVPSFPRLFGFEEGSVRLKDGEIFTVSHDAADRWAAIDRRDDFSPRCDFRIVYQLHDGRYVELTYRDCSCRTVYGREFWVSGEAPQGDIVSACYVAEFLLRHQCPLPPQLRSALDQQSTVEDVAEPIPELAAGGMHAHRLALAYDRDVIQAIDFRRTIEGIIPQGVRFVQFLRNPPLYWENRSLSVCGEFYASLAAVHPVDLKAWPAESGIPPEWIALLDWTWPPEYVEIQRPLKQLLDICEPALGCLWQVSTTGRTSPGAPSDSELDAARSALIARLPEIEAIVAEVRRVFQTFASGDGSPVRTVSTDQQHSPESPQGRTPDSVTTPPSAPELAAKMANLREQSRLALEGFEAARSTLSEIPSVTRVTDEMAYEWLREHRSATDPLPNFDTWARYLREARRELGVQKNRPRHGRRGRSVRKADEL